MFTGIVEAIGTVISVENKGSNKTFWVECSVSGELKVDQSVSHSGVCLTIEEIKDGAHKVTAIEETLRKTDLGKWQTGTKVNIERCLQMNGRLDGHIVQGHVDGTAVCVNRIEVNGSWEFTFEFAAEHAALVIEKGSICLNGISLTIFNVTRNRFTVAVIPYTFEHTNIQKVQHGDRVNIEFDLIGKYINRIASLK